MKTPQKLPPYLLNKHRSCDIWISLLIRICFAESISNNRKIQSLKLLPRRIPMRIRTNRKTQICLFLPWLYWTQGASPMLTPPATHSKIAWKIHHAWRFWRNPYIWTAVENTLMLMDLVWIKRYFFEWEYMNWKCVLTLNISQTSVQLSGITLTRYSDVPMEAT